MMKTQVIILVIQILFKRYGDINKKSEFFIYLLKTSDNGY